MSNWTEKFLNDFFWTSLLTMFTFGFGFMMRGSDLSRFDAQSYARSFLFRRGKGDCISCINNCEIYGVGRRALSSLDTD